MKKEKSAYVELEEKWLSQCQTISKQQELIAALRKSGEEMGNEITHLKRVIAGQKGRLQQLAKEVKRWKALELEADEMNEKRTAENDDLKATLCEKDKTIDGLISQVGALKATITENVEKITQLANDLSVIKTNVEYYNELPWIVKMFTFRIQ